MDFDPSDAGPEPVVVKQFDKVSATRAAALELVLKAAALTGKTAPIISGIEILPAP